MSDSNMLYIDMEVDDLAVFMFKKNVNNAVIELSIGGVEHNKDLFCFMVDLLCKGLVYMFGDENKVELESLTLDDFGKIKDKMRCAGIDVFLDVQANVFGDMPGINTHELENISDNAPLSDYKFKVTSLSHVYQISFNLIHKTL